MGKKKRDYYLPKELEQPEKYRHGLKYWLISDDKMEEALETRSFIQPQGFAEHLDFFLRYCASCEHSVIDIDIYTEDKKVEVNGKTILHKKGEIIMEVENVPRIEYGSKMPDTRKEYVNSHVNVNVENVAKRVNMDVEDVYEILYDSVKRPANCKEEVYSFINKQPRYEYKRIGGGWEDTRERMRFTFSEPDCWILDVPWQDWEGILKEYGRNTYMWHHFLISNPGNIRIGCGEIGFDTRMDCMKEFWRYIYFVRSEQGRPAR